MDSGPSNLCRSHPEATLEGICIYKITESPSVKDESYVKKHRCLRNCLTRRFVLPSYLRFCRGYPKHTSKYKLSYCIATKAYAATSQTSRIQMFVRWRNRKYLLAIRGHCLESFKRIIIHLITSKDGKQTAGSVCSPAKRSPGILSPH